MPDRAIAVRGIAMTVTLADAVAATGGSPMHDFELEATKRVTPPPARDGATPSSETASPFAPARSPALDAATVMHLQRTAGNAGVVQLLAGDEEQPQAASPVHDVVGTGGGSPLDDGTRSTMESAFGASFDDVRVHTDSQASQSAESVGANAYTVGSDVVFKSGQFDPGSDKGQRTIAHELAHVVQQSSGPVDGTDAPGGIRVSSPSDRFEQAADHTADQVMASVSAQRSTPSAAADGGAVAQLEESEDAAIPAVQREELPEEEEEAGSTG
jgi:hypothetical protein